MKIASNYFQKGLTPHKFFRLLNMKYSAYYVTLIYLFTKCLFFLNVTGQLNLLNRFVNHYKYVNKSVNYYIFRYLFISENNFGFAIWSAILQGNITWQETGIFPRVTWCDFDVGSWRDN